MSAFNQELIQTVWSCHNSYRDEGEEDLLQCENISICFYWMFCTLITMDYVHSFRDRYNCYWWSDCSCSDCFWTSCCWCWCSYRIKSQWFHLNVITDGAEEVGSQKIGAWTVVPVLEVAGVVTEAVDTLLKGILKENQLLGGQQHAGLQKDGNGGNVFPANLRFWQPLLASQLK